MSTQINPIQGNQFFQRVENTVVSSNNVENTLIDNGNLVTYVAKGKTLPVPTATTSDIPIYSSLPTDPSQSDAGSKRLSMPEGALVTRVIISPDLSVAESKRLTPGTDTSFKISSVEDSNNTGKTNITSTDVPKPAFKTVLGRIMSLDSSYNTTFSKAVFLVLDVGGANPPTTSGTLNVEVHYIIP